MEEEKYKDIELRSEEVQEVMNGTAEIIVREQSLLERLFKH